MFAIGNPVKDAVSTMSPKLLQAGDALCGVRVIGALGHKTRAHLPIFGEHFCLFLLRSPLVIILTPYLSSFPGTVIVVSGVSGVDIGADEKRRRPRALSKPCRLPWATHSKIETW